MTGKNHRRTALLFGAIISSFYFAGNIHLDEFDALSDLSEIAQKVIVCGLWMIGVMFGASAPDWLEIPLYFGKKRFTLIPHRTLTHWPVLWLIAGYALYHYAPFTLISIIAFGFISSSLLHITMDSLSSTGIPLLLPFSFFRVRFPLYKTGTWSEGLAVFLVFVSFSSFAYFSIA